MTIAVEKVLYTARATAQGGRDGKVATNDGKLDVTVAPPVEMVVLLMGASPRRGATFGPRGWQDPRGLFHSP